MIFDLFLYNGEKELLDIRVNELKNLPVKHVLLEGTHTFTGIEKPKDQLFNGEEFPPHVLHGTNPFKNLFLSDTWDTERAMRNMLQDMLKVLDPSPSDIIILSDVDEIPCWGRVEEFNSDELCCLQMDEYHLFLNTRYKEQSWRHPKVFKYQWLLDHPEMTFDMIRNAGGKVIEGGGWHFGWQGSREQILKKFESFSHQEDEVQQHATVINVGYCQYHLLHVLTREPLTIIDMEQVQYPQYIYHNQEKFKHLLYDRH